eukprot:g5137.t1
MPVRKRSKDYHDHNSKHFKALRAKHFPPGFPNGWHLKSISALGTYMVAFRGQDGKVGVMHAFCPHMGAHLGMGGVVVGNLLQCPFHGWSFDTSGECQHVPYRRCSREMPESSRLKAYEVREHLERIFIWFDAEGRPPQWELICHQRLEADVERLGVQSPQKAPLMRFPHSTWMQSRELRDEWHMASFEERTHGLFLFGHPSLPVPLSATISKSIETNVTFEGPTIVHFRIKTPLGVLRQVKTILPIEPFKQYVEARWYAEKRVPRIIACALACIGGRALEQDREVWENKVYHKKPVLVAGDGAFLDFIRWYDQFYSEKSKALSPPAKSQTSDVWPQGPPGGGKTASVEGLEALLLLKRQAPELYEEMDHLLSELSKPMAREAQVACILALQRCTESARFAREAAEGADDELSDLGTESALSLSLVVEEDLRDEEGNGCDSHLDIIDSIVTRSIACALMPMDHVSSISDHVAPLPGGIEEPPSMSPHLSGEDDLLEAPAQTRQPSNSHKRQGIPAELKSVHKTLKKLQSQSESLIRGQTESKNLLQRFEAGAVQVATNVGMPSAGSVGQRLATPGAHNFAGGRPGGAQLMRQASRGQLDSNPPPSLAPPSDQGIIRRTSVAIGMGGNVPFFGRPPAAAPPPQMVPQVVQMQVPAMQPLQPIQPMMAPMGVMPTAPTGGTRRASLAMGAVQGAAAAPAQQIQQMQAVLPAFQEADEDDEGFSDSSDEAWEEQKPENQKSPILNGVVKAGSETTPDAQAEHEEKDEDELSFSPSSKSDEDRAL